MWPWEHAAIGYLLFSIGLRLLNRDAPTERETVGLVVMSVLPDLIDKPLSWGLELTPSGYGVLHSVFIAIPVAALILVIAVRTDRGRLGVAVAVGYWSHLVADVLTPVRSGDQPIIERVLWPVGDTSGYAVDYGLGRGLVYLGEFVEMLLAMSPLDIVLYYLLIPASTVGLWVIDGKPGASIPRRSLAEIKLRLK